MVALCRYEKLMLRRIDWNAGREEEEEEGAEERPPNYCYLVWQVRAALGCGRLLSVAGQGTAGKGGRVVAGSKHAACGPVGRGANRRAPRAQRARTPPPPHRRPITLQGVVKDPFFRKFRSENAASEAGARKLLTDRGVGHFWELCEAYATDE